MLNKKLYYGLLALLLWTTSAFSEIEIVIVDGMSFARPIAVVPFSWQGLSAKPPHDVSAIIAADLRRSGQFNPVDFDELPQKQITSSNEIDLEAWRKTGVEVVIVGKVVETVSGKYRVSYEVVDVFKPKQQLINGELVTNQDYIKLSGANELERKNFRFQTHYIADKIYYALTGERGAFATQIAYISVDRTLDRPFQLFVADSDGHNPLRVYAGTEALMSPTWSPDGRQLAYVSFERGRSEVYLQNVFTGERNVIASFQGVNSAPVFSPDGRELALTLSKDGNAEIYVLNLVTRQFRRLTRHSAIDTEPAWSPDGKKIVFTSDRGGRPQIYRVPAQGGRAERLTFDGEYNASATYLPDGKSLILVNRTNGVYHIARQDIGGDLQVLTDTRLDESPSLAPNGSMVIYATVYRGRQVLAQVSADGRFKMRLPAKKGEVKAPAWSPYLTR